MVDGTETHDPDNSIDAVEITCLNNAFTPVTSGDVVELDQSASLLVIGDKVSIHESAAYAVLGDKVDVSGSKTGLVFANEVTGDYETVFTPVTAAIFGGAVAAGIFVAKQKFPVTKKILYKILLNEGVDNITETIFEKIWKAIPTDLKNEETE